MKDPSNALAGKYMTTVKLGPKGQLVIPKEARALYDLKPGDSLLLFAEQDRGIVLLPMEQYQELFSLFSQAFPPGETS